MENRHSEFFGTNSVAVAPLYYESLVWVPLRVMLWGLVTALVLAIQLMVYTVVYMIPALASTSMTVAQLMNGAAFPTGVVVILGFLMFRASARLHIEGYRWNFGRLFTTITVFTTTYSTLLHLARTTSLLAVLVFLLAFVLAVKAFPTVRQQLKTLPRNAKTVFVIALLSTSISASAQSNFQNYLRTTPSNGVIRKAQSAQVFDRSSRIEEPVSDC